MDPLPRGARSSTGYQLPTALRGVVVVGPLDVEVSDPLGLARLTPTIADTAEVIVVPRARLLDMPRLGQGVLGNELLAKARRLGPGEFHGLREYATGDEPRSIHWKSSARSDSLMVKEHAAEGLHRCTIVFDAAPSAHRDAAAFERGVTAAASLAHSAVLAGLTTRFVTAGGIDLRGPEVAAKSKLDPKSFFTMIEQAVEKFPNIKMVATTPGVTGRHSPWETPSATRRSRTSVTNR